MKLIITLFLFCLIGNAQTITLTDADILAVPNGVGHGANTTGGRGKPVYRVTNNSSSGAGSLRQAINDCAATDGGNIVFTTGMNISLSSIIYFQSDNVTIWGQSASGSGVTVDGYGLDTQGHENIIVQHLRIRPGDGTTFDTDAFRISANFVTGLRSNFYLKNMSLSWSDDEVFSMETSLSNSSLSDITIQNSIISEPFGSQYGTIVYGNITDVSYIQNYLANVESRSPENTTPNSEFEFINNLVYNYRTGARMAYDSELDWIGNTYKLKSGITQAFETLRIEVGTTSPVAGNVAGTKYFSDDNVLEGGTLTIGCAGCTASNYAQLSRINPSNYTPIPRLQAIDTIFEKSGARATMEGVDALDNQMFLDYTNDTGSFASNEAATSGLPTMTAGTAYSDSDNDGLSDAYETANGGSITQSTRPSTATLTDGRVIDQSGVTNVSSTGFTHLEIFMYERSNSWDDFTSGSTPPTGTLDGVTSQTGKKTAQAIIIVN